MNFETTISSIVPPDTTTPITTTTTTEPIPNTTIPIGPIFIDKCNYYIVNATSVKWLDFGNPYGGIPQNLLINAIGFVVLLLLFAILRRAAGNYGRLALIRKDDDESGWAQIFYSSRQGDNSKDDEYEEATFEGAGDLEAGDNDSITTADYSEVDSGMCSWLCSVFTLSDDMILRKCGIDAIQYIRFQRHLLVFMVIITIVCLTIILPVNFKMGNIIGGNQNFGHTTISNIPGTSDVLWVHIIIGVLFMPLGIFIMRRFSVSLRMEYEEENSVSSRTLMLDGIPQDYCKKDYIIRHFQEAYPSCEIDDVQIAFSVAKLTSLTDKLETAQRAVSYCENYHRRSGGKDLQINPHCWAAGILCTSYNCCTADNINAMEYYKEQEKVFKAGVDQEKAQLQANPIGIAFVTFSNLADAKRINRDHRKWISCLSSNPANSSLDGVLFPSKWDVRFAPPPEDIYWENLNRKKSFRTLKVWMVNILLFLILFFFTSPAYIMSVLETIPIFNANDFAQDVKNNLPVYVTDFIPTLLLWTLSALLPVMVAYSDWWLGHWRRSIENLWIMRKVFGYLLFMILILPSIGQTTLRAFIEGIIKKTKEDGSGSSSINWDCIFLPDNGAFFVNYVTTCALIGTGLEFIRFPELFMYALRLGSVKSRAEISSVRKAIVYEFPFGVNYAWMLLVFALTVSYSVICPLITPFGLFYFVIKHCVDRYNIYFAYKRSKINKNIHGCAVNCVCISLLIQQLMLMFFNTIRSKNETLLRPRAIFSITMFTIFCLLFIAQMFFHAFKGISPIQYTISSPQQQYTGPGTNHVSDTASTSSVNSGLSGVSSFARHNVRNRKFLPDVIRNFES